jgi:hypothetical protein
VTCLATLPPLHDSVFLVFEYLEHDMGRLLDTMPRPFNLSEVKCLVHQVRQPWVERA